MAEQAHVEEVVKRVEEEEDEEELAGCGLAEELSEAGERAPRKERPPKKTKEERKREARNKRRGLLPPRTASDPQEVPTDPSLMYCCCFVAYEGDDDLT